MKKIMNYAVVLFAGLSVVLSCSKIEKGIDNPVVEPGVENARAITITAILPEADTKVTYDAEYDSDSKPTAVKRNWESTDQLYIWNQDHTSSTILYLDSGDGTNTAVFKGNISFTSPSYDLEVASTAITDYSSQAQACDGDMGHIVFVAGQSGVTDLTAPVTLTETSGVLAIIAQLPDGVAEYVSSVVISDLATGNTVIALTTGLGDTDSDGIFKAYMNVTHGMALAQDEEYLIRFNTPGATQDFYTRYYKMGSDKALGDGKFQYLKLNCKHTDQHAGSPTACDGTSADKAYLIADGYQLQAVNALMHDSDLRYFKLIDDIDMTGFDWTCLNPSTPYKQLDFDGNYKTISKLSNSFFYVFYKSSIKNLTLDNCTASNGTQRGIFAQYIQGNGEHTVTNVDVTNSTVNEGNGCMGGLVGRINSTSGATTTATFTGCDVSDTKVSGKAAGTGGFIGSVEAKVVIENCSCTGGTVNNTSTNTGGFIGKASAEITVKNCTVNCTVKAGNYSGGFAGSIESSCTLTDNTIAGTVGPGSTVAGFAGLLQPGDGNKASLTRNTSSCSVEGKTNLGGFIGVLNGSASFSECSSTGAGLTASSGTAGGFIGSITGGSIGIDKSHATTDISVGGSYGGGFIGQISGGTINITRCYATGKVTSSSTYASAFISNINNANINITIQNCYATGNIINSNQMRGGLIAQLYVANSATISNCYSTGEVVGSFRLGGLIGNLRNTAAVVENCAAWNSKVEASSHGQTNWSSGAIIGTVHPNAHVSNCFRSPDMSLTVYCPPPTSDWDHPDIDGTTHPLYQNSQVAPFTWGESTFTDISAGTSNVDAGRWGYHGKHVASGTTLSQLASTPKASGGLGWDSTIWDFSGELPTLR